MKYYVRSTLNSTQNYAQDLCKNQCKNYVRSTLENAKHCKINAQAFFSSVDTSAREVKEMTGTNLLAIINYPCESERLGILGARCHNNKDLKKYYAIVSIR